MRRVFWLIGVLLVLCGSVRAQEYRLRLPDAEEYLAGITEIFSDPLNNNIVIRNAIKEQIALRYGALRSVDSSLILQVYEVLKGWPNADRDLWNKHIIGNWFTEQLIDLSLQDSLVFYDYQIEVIPRDLNNDGVDEYILDVVKNPLEDFDRNYRCGYPAEYVDYLVVQQNGSAYKFVEIPLAWYGVTGGDLERRGGVFEVRFDDLNADGFPEWVLLTGGHMAGGPGMGYANVGHLVILGWRERRLVDLTRASETASSYITHYEEDAGVCHGAEPRDVTWEFVNLDTDDAQEILQHQVYVDNWHCLSRETKVIDWDAAQDRYVLAHTYADFPDDTRNCAYRQAEEAMWSGEYTQALAHYERGAMLEPAPIESSEWERAHTTYEQYHQARMALAYLLTEQPEKAQTILKQLRTQDFTHESVRQFVEALLAAPQTPFESCLAAYNTFAEHYQPFFQQSYPFGLTRKQTYGSTFDEYSPARIGCDAPAMLRTALEAQSLTAGQMPVAALKSLGIPVEKSLNADLNHDGQDEWLVWLQYSMNPLFFALDADGVYRVSTPAVDPFHYADDLHVWPLPDDTGLAIAYLISDLWQRTYPAPWYCVYDHICGLGGPPECTPETVTGLTMWRMDGLVLTPVLQNQNVCRSEIAALFPDGEGSSQIDGGEWMFTTEVMPVRYQWDAETNTFIRVPVQPVDDAVPASKYITYAEAMRAEDYSEALHLVDSQALRSWDYDQDNPESMYRYRYQRAFVLKKLNRPDEALTEYLAILESAPDSAWGMLAALHVEVVD